MTSSALGPSGAFAHRYLRARERKQSGQGGKQLTFDCLLPFKLLHIICEPSGFFHNMMPRLPQSRVRIAHRDGSRQAIRWGSALIS
jgi:hypothetical protein